MYPEPGMVADILQRETIATRSGRAAITIDRKFLHVVEARVKPARSSDHHSAGGNRGDVRSSSPRRTRRSHAGAATRVG